MTYDELKAKFLQTLPTHIGYGGLISQLNGDQGDTAQRTGTLVTLLALLNDSDLNSKIIKDCPLLLSKEKAYQALDSGFSWYRRSINPAFSWETDDRQTSRDQLSILRLGMASSGMKLELFENLLAQVGRLVFHQNYWNGEGYQLPDLISPDEIGTFARGFLGWFSEIVTNFTDFTYAINMILRNYNALNIWSSDNMLAQNLLVAAHLYPSLVGKLCIWQYKKTDFMSRLWSYHKDSDGNNGCECLYWLFRMAYLKLEGYDPESTAP